jgi:hypothetical protein
VQADPQAQATFKQHLRPLLREVATAFPHATVELWAVDEHRIGLKPILRKVWTLAGHRPIAPVEHRYDWRSVVGFVHPASGRTLWHLATTVSIELFSVELEAFAHAVRASPIKQIVLVQGGAGWHDSPKVCIPEHVHLLFIRQWICLGHLSATMCWRPYTPMSPRFCIFCGPRMASRHPRRLPLLAVKIEKRPLLR